MLMFVAIFNVDKHILNNTVVLPIPLRRLSITHPKDEQLGDVVVDKGKYQLMLFSVQTQNSSLYLKPLQI